MEFSGNTASCMRCCSDGFLGHTIIYLLIIFVSPARKRVGIAKLCRELIAGPHLGVKAYCEGEG